MNVGSRKLASAFMLIVGMEVFLGGCHKAVDPSARRPESPTPPPAAALTAVDINGIPHTLFPSPAQGTLLVFVLQDCPIANAYAPKIQRIREEFSARGIAVYVVQVDPGATAEALRKHAEDYGLQGTILHDTTHELARFAAATVTPQAVLFDHAGQAVYSGRIDDQYVAFGVKRQAAGREDLILALEALLDGKPITPKETKAIGCYIADLLPAP